MSMYKAMMELQKKERKTPNPYVRNQKKYKPHHSPPKNIDLISDERTDDDKMEIILDELWELVQTGYIKDDYGEIWDAEQKPGQISFNEWVENNYITDEDIFEIYQDVIEDVFREKGVDEAVKWWDSAKIRMFVPPSTARGREIGDSLEGFSPTREVKVKDERSDDGAYIHANETGDLRPQGEQLVPIGASDYNKNKKQDLVTFVNSTLGKAKEKFTNNIIGPNKEVNVIIYTHCDDKLPDGVAVKVLELIKRGHQFGKIKMDKYGDYVQGHKRKQYEIEREEEYPERPNITERDRLTGRARWKNEPTSEDRKKEGWQKVLETTNPSLQDTKDITVTSRIIRTQKGSDRQYKNYVMIVQGDYPLFMAGIRVNWDMDADERTLTETEPFINEEVLNWRKW